jgi:class 3 adenylate cyclase/tetratricopeptide (TPR) repeat protein
VPICTSCGTDNPEEAKFCLACGAKLGDARPHGEVRKTVTVLFADVTGSTALGERLDPESTRRVMARWFERARTVLERHGASVEKFIGDAVMAVFGVPTVHEDDAFRAVRAAKELQQELAAVNDELERDYGVRLEIRTGVNTGEVVTGQGETLATGDAVNVAARLEQAAGPGEILIGAPTERLVRDAVVLEPIEPLTLKGKSAGVPAFALHDVIEGAEPFARRLDSPLVGRERERRLLEQAFERAVEERACHLFTLLGPAGIGKSRLAHEFLSGLGEKALVVRGRCLPYGEGITYWPLLEILRQLGNESGVVQLLEGEPDARLVVNEVTSAVGLADSAGSGEETFWAVRKLFEALARERPLVVVIDDLQWAETTFVDLVEHVADWSRETPILLLCLARPELLDDRPGWAGGKLNATSILLEPLSDDETGTLIGNLLTQLADDVRTRVTEAAEGNPLFVEQMVAMVAENGDVREEISVPPTIQALLAARLDRLESGERTVIESASVVGKEFWPGAVAELAPAVDVRPTVQQLVRKELIRPVRSVFAAGDAFRFRHQLIRDAAYAGMAKEARAEQHERFADWLEASRSGYEEIVGHHLEQAFRYREELGPIDDAARAVAFRAGDHLATAGLRAFRRGDYGAASNLLDRAAALYPADASARIELLPDLARALYFAGELGRATEVVETAIPAAHEAGDARTEQHARLIRANLSLLTESRDAFSLARPDAEQAIEVFTRLEDDTGLAYAWTLLATLTFFDGQAAKAEQALARALEHAERADARVVIREAEHWQGGFAIFGPTPADEGIRRFEALVESSDAIREADALRPLAVFHAMQGDFDEARRAVARIRTVVEELGHRLNLAIIAFWSAPVERLAGDLPAAERELRASIEALERMGEKGFLSTMAAEHGDVLYELGRYGEARRASLMSEEAAAPDDMASQVLWRSVRAKLLAREQRFDEAERLGREALAILGKSDYLDYQASTRLSLAEVLRLAGRHDEAAQFVKEAIGFYEAKGNVVLARRTKALLAEVTTEELAQRE